MNTITENRDDMIYYHGLGSGGVWGQVKTRPHLGVVQGSSGVVDYMRPAFFSFLYV